LTVSGVSAISPAASVQPSVSNRAAASTTQSPSAASASSGSGPPLVNPGLHLDPALNIVVLQFFDSKGDVTQTIPSQKQIQAYQQEAGQKTESQPSKNTYIASDLTAPS
jgi:hypothetical protein